MPSRSVAGLFFLLASFLCHAEARPEGEGPQPVSLSDSIGPEIDGREREAYRLFPDIQGFQSARIYRLSNQRYRLDYTYQKGSTSAHQSRRISASAVDLTRLHVRLVESYRCAQRPESTAAASEADLLYRLTLRYASRCRYDAAAVLIDDLRQDFPTGPRAQWAGEVAPGIQMLQKRREALIWPGTLLDRRGRTEVMIFSGYYGLWLGIATPIALDADSPQAYATGLLLGGPLSVALAHNATRNANVTRGRATMISLAGHLGTWQGIGWAADADADARAVIGIGELAGLAGIATVIVLTDKVDFSEGHAGLSSSGLQWGAWFGIVADVLAEEDADHLLESMLIGSDVLVLGTGIAARHVQMSQTRVRLINLGGLIGMVFGFGLDLLTQVDDGDIAISIAGAGSIGGLALAARMTRDFDKGRELSLVEAGRWCPSLLAGRGGTTRVQFPELSVRRDLGGRGRVYPAVGVRIDF